LASYANLSSTELVQTCAACTNDELAWAEFIRRFQVVIAAAVLRTARHWCEPSRSQLDDLVQDTYLKLCENDCRLLRTFKPRQEDSIYGFLKVVAANVVHDHFKAALATKRGASQTEAIVDTEPVRGAPAKATIDSFDIVSHDLQIDRIDKILTQGTSGKDAERNRTIFWLRHRQGLTASEIATIRSFGLTTEGVESVLIRQTNMICLHFSTSTPHRKVKANKRKDVKGIKRKNRSNRMGM
jgi:RNA polymerase sigma-70 factor (ECF subfamily)